MYLRRLSDNGGAAVTEWRRMWNDEVLPHLESLRLAAGPGLRIDRHPNGTVIRLAPLPGSARSAAPADPDFYHSYFKLTLSSATANGATVRTAKIADGATGGNSVAVVNGYTVYSIPPYTEVVNADRLFYLKYRPAVYNATGGTIDRAVLTIGSLGPNSSGDLILPEGGTDHAFYTQLGRVLWRNGVPKVVQDFTSGVADVRWYAHAQWV